MKLSAFAPILALSLALPLAGCLEQQQAAVEQAPAEVGPRPAKIVELSNDRIQTLRTYPGTIEAAQQADLAFRVGGQLIELPAEAGLRVKKGDLLARIDPQDFENTLAERRARYDLANTKYSQASKLRKKNIASKASYDEASAELRSARAALAQAKDSLKYTELLAPFDGVVARVNIENYQPVKAQEPIIELRTEDALAIRFSVPESIVARLKPVEDPALIDLFCGKVRLSTRPDLTFKACHLEHETVPDPLTRNYAGLYKLEPIEGFAVLPGMTGTIELDFSDFLADQSGHSVYAPIEAVFSDQGKQWVWTVDEQMIAHRQEVRVGRIEADQIEITSDIDPQTRVIAAGVSYVREGMQVRPIVKQRGL